MTPGRGVRSAARALAFAVLLLAPKPGLAQTDEIQVYDAGIAERGRFNLTWHNNFTPRGLTTPAFPGALLADKSLNGVPEWAYGVTDWFEAGLYMPLYSVGKQDAGGGASARLDGFKLRLLFVAPRADDRRFFYGVNFEFSDNARHWDSKHFTSEVRPILGWHLNRVDVVLNPILDTAYDGLKNLEFVPATRVAYNWNKTWATAIEEYGDFGPLRGFRPKNEQSHQLYAVVDRTTKSLNVEVGIGVGLTRGADRLTLKVILSRDLN